LSNHEFLPSRHSFTTTPPSLFVAESNISGF
jgi:hypothetical protein